MDVDADGTGLLGHPFVRRAARWGLVAWSAIGVALLGYLFARFVLHPVRVIFPPLVVALLLVYLLNPLVNRLQNRGMPRLLAALLTYIVFLAIIAVALRLLIPAVAEQVRAFSKSVPTLLDRAQDALRPLAERLGFQFETGASAAGGQSDLVRVLGNLLSFTRGLIHAAVVMVLGPILGFYLLVDLPKIRRTLEALIPVRRRAEVKSVLRDLSRALGGFFRGQLLVAVFVGAASSLALFIVGLPYWALIGMISGLFNLIPLIGPFIGMVFAVFVAFTVPAGGQGLLSLEPGWPLALAAVLALLIVQQIDNHIVSPNIVARTVKLHPVTVMLGLLAGGTLLGLWGMLLAVPTIAGVKILLLHAWDTRVTWPPPDDAEPGEPAASPLRPAVEGAADRQGLLAAWTRRWFGRRPPAGDDEPKPGEPEKARRP